MTDISFKVSGVNYAVGDFSCLSKTELKALNKKQIKKGSISYEYVHGDITELLKTDIGEHDVVQAASQFNLLEMGYPGYRPENGISIYTNDGTQGPRVALSSPAGTFFRNYLIFNGKPQRGENFKSYKQVNTLSEVLEDLNIKEEDKSPSLSKIDDDAKKMIIIGKPSPNMYTYINGYAYINFVKDVDEKTLNDTMDKHLRVGIQWNTPDIVNKGKLCQVYSSALPLSYYTYHGKNIDKLATSILTSTYKCVLEVAISKISESHPRINVYLTAVGGGVFGNEFAWIQKALINALFEYRTYPLNVKLIWNTDPSGVLANYFNVSTINQKLMSLSLLPSPSPQSKKVEYYILRKGGSWQKASNHHIMALKHFIESPEYKSKPPGYNKYISDIDHDRGGTFAATFFKTEKDNIWVYMDIDDNKVLIKKIEVDDEDGDEDGDSKLISYLKSLNNEKQVVLLETGSLNPAHKTHLRMASLAAGTLNSDTEFVKKNGPVVAVVLSPTHDRYVRDQKNAKTPKDAIPGITRKKLLDLSIKDFAKENPNKGVRLFSNDWEITQDDFVDFPNVTSSLHYRLKDASVKNTQVMYLSGADLLKNAVGSTLLTGHNNGRTSKHSVVSVNRIDSAHPTGIFTPYDKTKYGKNHYLIDISEDEKKQYCDYDQAASSTSVRKALKTKSMQELNKLVFPSALKYIIENNYLGFSNAS